MWPHEVHKALPVAPLGSRGLQEQCNLCRRLGPRYLLSSIFFLRCHRVGGSPVTAAAPGLPARPPTLPAVFWPHHSYSRIRRGPRFCPESPKPTGTPPEIWGWDVIRLDAPYTAPGWLKRKRAPVSDLEKERRPFPIVPSRTNSRAPRQSTQLALLDPSIALRPLNSLYKLKRRPVPAAPRLAFRAAHVDTSWHLL